MLRTLLTRIENLVGQIFNRINDTKCKSQRLSVLHASVFSHSVILEPADASFTTPSCDSKRGSTRRCYDESLTTDARAGGGANDDIRLSF